MNSYFSFISGSNADFLVKYPCFNLCAAPYERSDQRNGYANGLKDRTFQSTAGALNLRVPQPRESDKPYNLSMLQSGSRTDQVLKATIATTINTANSIFYDEIKVKITKPDPKKLMQRIYGIK